MLPDFPEIKKAVLDRLRQRARAADQADPLLGLMPRFVVHEGDRSVVRREDGHEEVLELRKNPIEAEVQISTDRIRLGGPDATREAVDRLSEGMREGMARRTFAAIEEAAESVGNTVKVGGPFTADVYFAALEKMQLSFDESGEWLGIQFVCHPETAAKAAPVFDSIESVPELKARRDEIVAQKREEWRVREAARQLVD